MHKTDKKPKPKILWSADLKYNEYEGECNFPLYAIAEDGKHFQILFHGVCAIRSAYTFEEAQTWVREKLEEYRKMPTKQRRRLSNCESNSET